MIYIIILNLKHFHPNLMHYSSITFYSLPLTLVQQILINFNTFHLFIISISILQYFIRYYRLLKNKYSLNIYNGRNLLITKHTNVAIILSGSLALIFGYNYIFYSPKYPQTKILLPLITLNMVLLPLINLIIFIFIIICCIINISKMKYLLKSDVSFDNQSSQQQQQQQQQCLTDNLRSTIEKATCVKCYSKFLRQNRSLLQETDPYTKLHSRFFSHNLLSSTRPSITPSDDIRKYSTISYENIPMFHDGHSRLRTSYPCQVARNFLTNKINNSQQDFSNEQRMDIGRNSTNELFLQSILLKLKDKHSFCHLSYRLLLIFLFKYVLLTFPQHIFQMIIYLIQFYDYIIKYNTSNNNQNQNQNSNNNPNNNNSHSYFHQNNEFILTICRFLFLFARFGDCLLLTRIPYLIKKYFPCWCHFNSKLLRKQQTFQRVSHQVLMKNTDSSTNEPLSAEDLSNSNDLPIQQDIQYRHHQRRQRHSSRIKTHQYRLRFQFVPIWSKKREKLFRENC